MDTLFSRGFIGDLELANRIVMPAIKTGFFNESFGANERYLDFLEARARGGAALLIVEAFSGNHMIMGEAGEDVLHENAAALMQELAGRVHAAGANIALQLGQAAAVQDASPDRENNRQAVMQVFVGLAEAAAAAGFDALEIQGDFCGKTDYDPVSRDLYYKNLFASIHEKVKLPLIYRLSETGRGSLDDVLHVCRIVELAGAAAIHIPVNPWQTLEPPGFLIPLAAAVKKAVRIPVIAAGRINRPELAAELLKHGAADFISMGRALLADPELPRKAERGCLEQIRPCTGCNEGCINRYMAGEPITCVQNLAVGREKELSDLPEIQQPKKILVAGGGPAGMTAAKYLAKRGHCVRLVEKLPQLGGQVNIAALVPGKQDYRFITTCLEEDLSSGGVEISLNTSLTSLREEEMPDVVIVASGSEAKKLLLLYGLTVPVFSAREIILSNSFMNNGQVLVIGAGLLGLEAAYTLATRGSDVVVVEQEQEIARDGPPVYKNHLLKKLEGRKVKILTGTAILGGEGAKIKLQNLLSGETTYLCAGGGVVVAVGAEPVCPEKLQGQNDKLHVIGDARLPGKILAAMEEALVLALKL
ncbi:MAG: FAD-dependent oxidoreductase [Bacillota bacterium]